VVDSDEPPPFPAPGASLVVTPATRNPPRPVVAAPEGPRSVPEETVHELSDLLYVPGEREQLRIGYRVPEDAPDELRALLARLLDSVEIRSHAGARPRGAARGRARRAHRARAAGTANPGPPAQCG
jgi:hypothetical protein